MATPAPPPGPWTSPRSPHHSIHPVSLPAFTALSAGDLPLASSFLTASLQLALPSFLISDNCRGIWRRRLDLVAADPEHLPWISRLIVYSPSPSPSDSQNHDPNPDPGMQERELEGEGKVIVGRVGFHGKPDSRGMVEVGYEIDPTCRGKGHAKAALRIIVDIAREIQGVKLLRASIKEENWISKKVVEGEGLRMVGRQCHVRRGWEDIFERDVSL